MSRTRVLIVNSAKAGPVTPLLADPGLDTVVLTEPWYADRYPAGTRVETVPRLEDLAAVLEVGSRLSEEARIDAVVAPTERSLRPGGLLRSALGIPGPDFGVATGFSDKLEMKRRLRAAGVPVADSAAAEGSPDRARALRNAAERVGYPAVVKPALGTGATHMRRVEDDDDLCRFLATDDGARLLARPGRLTAERWVPMRAEYHADGVVLGGATSFLSVGRYLMPLLGREHDFTGSYVLPDGDEAAEVTEAVSDLHDRAVCALGLVDGVTHLEVFGTQDGFVVGEITCRPGGGGIPRTVQLAHGVDLWDAFRALSVGRRPWLRTERSPGVVVNVDLPLRHGRIRRVSTSAELEELPEVVEAPVTARAGDVVSGVLHSSSSAGVAYLQVPTEPDVDAAVGRLALAYRLETDTDPPGGPANPVGLTIPVRVGVLTAPTKAEPWT